MRKKANKGGNSNPFPLATVLPSLAQDHCGLETGTCAWICYYSLETFGRLRYGEGIFVEAVTREEIVHRTPRRQ